MYPKNASCLHSTLPPLEVGPILNYESTLIEIKYSGVIGVGSGPRKNPV